MGVILCSAVKCDHSFPLAEDRDQRLSDSMQYLTLEGEDTTSLNGGDLFVVSVRLEPGDYWFSGQGQE